MAALKNLSGLRFGLLVVIERKPMDANRPHWKCKCDCGKEHIVESSRLISGNTKSCGCNRWAGHRKTHGMKDSKEYDIWSKMKARCQKQTDKSFHRYGGRGISFDPRWESFESFYEDMGPRPSQRHTLERIDNNGNYCKENCRWATYVEQGRNKGNNRLITHDGTTMCLSEWAEVSTVTAQHLRGRIRDGWGFNAAISAPVGMKRKEAAKRWPGGFSRI